MSCRQPNGVSVCGACRRLGLTRQAYYQHLRRLNARRQDEYQVLGWVRAERAKNPRMGTRKLYHKLGPRVQAAGIKMGRDALFNLLAHQGLLVALRRRRGPRTSDGAATWWKNILRQTVIDRPNQGWVADISYLRTTDGFCYMALVSDVYSRKIIGWDVSQSLELDGAMRALNMALESLPDGATPIHHSDRGSQYRSKAYTGRLINRGCLVSMTETDHCAENAQAERINGILKGEYYLDVSFANIEQARQAVASAIRLYNTDRPHLSLNYQLPEQVHQAA